MFYCIQIFWSDRNRGTIEVYDTKTNKMNVLAKSLNMPGSMAFDSTLGLLFWCNVEIIGSIERINFDGSDRYVQRQGCLAVIKLPSMS